MPQEQVKKSQDARNTGCKVMQHEKIEDKLDSYTMTKDENHIRLAHKQLTIKLSQL